MDLPPPDLSRVQADVTALVEQIGPRPAGSPAARQAARYVEAGLREAGWEPVTIGLPGNLLACRGAGDRLFLAHTDSVAASPGAVDNAAGVAILLELARTSPAPDLCLGFPVAEEIGLIGSSHMAVVAEAFPGGDLPRLVVSLDLTGQGALSAMGFGPSWSPAALAWLGEAWAPARPETPWAYQVYSRLLPQGERSDHAPFSEAGRPALLLFGRGEGGVFARYHQPSDRSVEPAALAETLATLTALAEAPSPPDPRPEEHAGALLFGRHLPGSALTALIGAGLLSGLADARALPQLPGQLLKSLLCALAAAAASALVFALPGAPIAEAEATAAAVMGMPATGWWVLGPFAWSAGLLVFVALRARLGPQGSAPLASAVLAALALLVDPLLAAPFALGALLGRLHPLLCAAPVLFLLRPDALRELSFHGLLPPMVGGLVYLLAAPALGSYRRGPRP